MRVIAGSLGGRRLASPRGLTVRPTGDRARETLFAVLGSRVEGIRVADLFAGTGAVGLEALSRGAAWAAFAERDRSALAALSENIRRLGVQDRSLVLPLDWESACRRLAAGGGAFGLVFADPPYDTDLAERCLRSRFTDAMLAPGGLVVIEHRRTRVLPPPPDHLALLDQRRAGEAVFSIYQRRSGAACEPSTRARSIP